MLGAVGALGLTLAAQSLLMWQARNAVERDLDISAQLMLERADDATQSAIDLLDGLAQYSGLSCTNDHRYLYSEATRSNAWIDTIGLVDRNGNLVCTDMGQSSRQAGLLPVYQMGDKEVSLSLSGRDEGDKELSLLVIRHIANGRRLIARIPGELIRIDPVRNDLRRYRTAMLSLVPNTPWFYLEPQKTGGDTAARAHAASQFLPFDVQISVPEEAIVETTHEQRELVHLGGIVLGLIGIAGGFLLGRHRPDGGDRLRDALQSGEFLPYMQPIVDLDSGRITGCEVLARWNLPDGSVIPPHEFIPLAQTYHLTHEVTRHIMGEARDAVIPLIEAGVDMRLSFNLFSRQLSDDKIVADIRAVFKDSPVRFEDLIFEISDRIPVSDTDYATEVISQIRALGSEIALDDVGSGHSGLNNLSTLGIDILKLDKLMLDSMSKGSAGIELVRSLIELASSLGIGVIAEGIESEEQVIRLRKMGVSAAQGYLFAPPLPARSFVELMLASKARGKKTAEAPKAGKGAGKEDDIFDADAA